MIEKLFVVNKLAVCYYFGETDFHTLGDQIGIPKIDHQK